MTMFSRHVLHVSLLSLFFFSDAATTEIYTYCHTLSLHAALPISCERIVVLGFQRHDEAGDGIAGLAVRARQANRHRRDQRRLRQRSEVHTSELQSLMRISYAVFCLKKKIDSSSLLHSPFCISYYSFSPTLYEFLITLYFII